MFAHLNGRVPIAGDIAICLCGAAHEVAFAGNKYMLRLLSDADVGQLPMYVRDKIAAVRRGIERAHPPPEN